MCNRRPDYSRAELRLVAVFSFRFFGSIFVLVRFAKDI